MAYIPFSERAVWDDITPIAQDDGPKPVVPIQYSAQFTDTMNYFRAILAADEKSQRAFDLTSEVIMLNSANYTAWQFRRQCLHAIGDIEKWKQEFSFMEERLEENPKNYQIWFHRQRVVLHLKDFSREKVDIKTILNEDAKNYHAWTHRQWLVRTFDLWDGELEFIDEFLARDIRNNSLWNHRWFVVTKLKPIIELPKKVVLKEMEFALQHIPKAVHNEAAWAYLSGFLRGRSLRDFPSVKKTLDAIRAKHQSGTLVPMMVLDYDIAVAEGSDEATKHAVELCEQLACADETRKKYWNMCKLECQKKLVRGAKSTVENSSSKTTKSESPVPLPKAENC